VKPIAATETAIVNPRSAHAHLKTDSKHTSMFIFMFAHAEGSDEEGNQGMVCPKVQERRVDSYFQRR
jgi:hypothetical protein